VASGIGIEDELAEVTEEVDEFLLLFNEVRPHESLACRQPRCTALIHTQFRP